MSDSHWEFIVVAYFVTACVIGGMVLKILLDYRGLKRALDKIAGAMRDDIA
jgi:heme exporter protein CcmD